MRKYENTRNPILPLDIHVPDGEAHVMPDGRLYIYGSFDDRASDYCSEKYHVISTPDMKEWTFHDVSFEGRQVPWFYDPDAPKYPGIDWSNPTPFLQNLLKNPHKPPVLLEEEKAKREAAKKAASAEADGVRPAFLYAPDAIHKDGKYYLYFCMCDNSEGVAVSDKPEGPFEHPVQFPCGGIDPAVFVDTDGQAYYYWGQLFLKGVKLNPDMMSFDETQVVDNLITEEEHFFHEGASMRKIGETYYLVYSNMERGKPTSLGYATSKSPLGPFTYRGIIVNNEGCDPASWNNHGSIEEFNGQWYVFYHRSSGGSQVHRRLCIEPITIHEDGSIREVPMTSQGVGSPFESGETIYGYQACQLNGTIFIDVDGAGSEWLTNISPGDEAVFRYVTTDQGYRSIAIEAEGEGMIDCYLDDCLVGSVNLGAASRSEEKLTDNTTGVRTLRLVIKEAKQLKIKTVTLY